MIFELDDRLSRDEVEYDQSTFHRSASNEAIVLCLGMLNEGEDGRRERMGLEEFEGVPGRG